MQLKKSPSANLENKRLTYVLVGLVFALSVLYVAFEWTESDIVVAEITDQAVETFEDEMIDNTTQEDETPPPPEPAIVNLFTKISSFYSMIFFISFL